jgi:hypothetical protein
MRFYSFQYIVLRIALYIFVYLSHKHFMYIVYLLVIIKNTILDAFAKLRSGTISFIRSLRPSVRPSRTTRLPLEGFSWNLILEYLPKNLSRKFKYHSNLRRIMSTLRGELCTFVIISRSVFSIMRNISAKICREYRNTHFMINNFSPKFGHLRDSVERYGTDR